MTSTLRTLALLNAVRQLAQDGILLIGSGQPVPKRALDELEESKDLLSSAVAKIEEAE